MISNVNVSACLEDLIQTISGQEYSENSSVQTVLENIEALALEAGELEKHGFQDVCLLVQERISDIGDAEGLLTGEQYSLLNKWHELASVYLEHSSEETATALLEYCCKSGLFGEMQDSDLDIIKDMLGQEYINNNKQEHLPQSEKHNNADNLKACTLEQLIAQARSNRQLGILYSSLQLKDGLALSSGAEDGQDKSQHELHKWLNLANDFMYGDNRDDTAKQLEDFLRSEVSEFYNNAIDISLLFKFDNEQNINGALIAPFTELLDIFYAHGNELDPVLTELAAGIEKLGLTAGEQSLLGFQDCCLIVTEYITDICGAGIITKTDLSQLIAEFLFLTRDYLLEPESKETNRALFEYLTNERWPKAISREDLVVLQEIMFQETNHEILPAETKSTDSAVEKTDEKGDAYEEIDTSDTLATPHKISRELVEMLQEEMLSIQTETTAPLKKLDFEEAESAAAVTLLEEYALRIERFASACQAAEMDGLYQACNSFLKNLHHFTGLPEVISPDQKQLLLDWPDSLLSYLQAPDEIQSSVPLLEILQHEKLPEPLISSVAPALTNLLQAALITDEQPHQDNAQKSVTTDDISITLPADINQHLLDGLMLELPGQMESLSAVIQSMVNGSGNLEDVQQAQRIAHTVKGAANTVGVKGIATLTHELEDILSALIKFNRLAPQQLALTMIEAADCLEEMSEALATRGTAPANSLEILKQLVDWSNRIATDGDACLGDDVEVATSKATEVAEQAISEKSNEPDTDAENNVMIQVPVSLIDNALRLLGESKIITAQLQERIKQSEQRSQSLIKHQNVVQNLVSDLEIQVDINSGVTHRNNQHEPDTAFDSLEFEEYNELHTVTNRIVEASVDSYEFNKQLAFGFSEIDELLVEKSRLHQEIQELIMRSRMVPISKIVPRLQRIVRQTGRSTGKQVNLVITGADSLIDSDVLNKLIDPLMHMLRNAVDHGIETAESRLGQNKPVQGQLTLEFMREGNQVHIRCQDDGAGLSKAKILEKAISAGLVDTNEDIDDTKLYRLILKPGFTTRETVTQTSGRGVGMDVVNTQIQSIKGSVHIESEPGQGCLIQIKVPVTLGTTHAILVRSKNRIIAVSNHAVERILHPGDFIIENSEDGFIANFNSEQLPMRTLESLLSLPAERRNTEREHRPALLIEDNELNYIVTVQEIIDTRDLYVKSMGEYLTAIKGVPGATILGDGSVVPVVDLAELISAPAIGMDMTAEMTKTDIINSLPIALVVDDSLSARRALAQVVQDAGFDVRTAKDGLEAIEIIDKCNPDILLVDMEMPRMNGVELTSHVRGSKDIKDLPVIMITSRTTDKHRKTATDAGVNVYLTKPFSEDNLIDHVHALLN